MATGPLARPSIGAAGPAVAAAGRRARGRTAATEADSLRPARGGLARTGRLALGGTARPSARARYCSAACRQRAYRERHPSPAVAEAATLRYRHTAAGGVAVSVAGRAVAHTIYECPLCDARSLGERRCADCNRFCRALGLGGACTHCDEPVLIADLLGKEVLL